MAAERNRILMVGVSTRALAESAARAGYACFTVDAFGDLDQRAVAPGVALARDHGRRYSAPAAVTLARANPATRVVYVANLENHPAAVRRLARGRVLLGNTARTLLLARDPVRLAEVARGCGVRAPTSLPAGAEATADEGVRWLRKPRRGGGGSGVRFWSPGARLGRHEILQEWIGGLPVSVAFVADGRRAVVLGMARQLVGEAPFGAAGFRYCGSVYPLAGIGGELWDRVEALVAGATAAFGLRGLNGIDLILRGEEAFALELNPRFCASMELMEAAHGRSVFEAHVAACGGQLPQGGWSAAAPVAWGKAIVYARRDVAMGDTRSWPRRGNLRDIPHPGERIRRGSPICTVLATERDPEACHAALGRATAALEREVYGNEHSAAA